MQVPPILQMNPMLFDSSAFSNYKTATKPVIKKFKCPHLGCDRSFAKSDHLRTHVRTHTGERPFRCTHEDCQKEFSDLANLKRHMRVHTGERPFTCPEKGCGKQFSVSSNLKQHMRVHTGERPYSCPICGKAFGHVSSRRKHMNIHEGAGYKGLLEKREGARRSSTALMPRPSWRSTGAPHLVARSPHYHPTRRPSSRGSESSYESISPTGPYPGPQDPLRPYHPTHFTFSEPPAKKEAVSRPRPYYPGPAKENTNTLNMVRPPPSPMETEHVPTRQEDPVPTWPRHPTPEETAVTAGRLALARCVGFNQAVELGRYITVAMDSSYKIASLAVFLYHSANRAKLPRQVPVRTIQ